MNNATFFQCSRVVSLTPKSLQSHKRLINQFFYLIRWLRGYLRQCFMIIFGSIHKRMNMSHQAIYLQFSFILIQKSIMRKLYRGFILQTTGNRNQFGLYKNYIKASSGNNSCMFSEKLCSYYSRSKTISPWRSLHYHILWLQPWRWVTWKSLINKFRWACPCSNSLCENKVFIHWKPWSNISQHQRSINWRTSLRLFSNNLSKLIFHILIESFT